MRSILLGAVAALGLWPAVASAVIVVRPTSQSANPGQLVSVEVFADPATLVAGVNERLNAYTMTVSAPQFAGPNDPSFVIPANFTFAVPENYVFGPNDPPFDPTSGSNRALVFLSATASSPAEVDIAEGRNRFARVEIRVPETAIVGTNYVLTVDQDFLSLGSAGAPIEAIGGTGTLTIVHEPASLGLVAIGGRLALRRRRTA